jgi:hypothetical protein
MLYFQLYNVIILQVTGITSGRAAALLPVGLGLISVIIGWIALSRSRAQIRNARSTSIIAFSLGLIATILSVLHLIRTSESTIGTGSGRLGAIVALVVGTIGIFLAARAHASSTKNNQRVGR